jgi:hypothetical protein
VAAGIAHKFDAVLCVRPAEKKISAQFPRMLAYLTMLILCSCLEAQTRAKILKEKGMSLNS